MARVPDGQEATVHVGELAEGEWVHPRLALERWRAGHETFAAPILWSLIAMAEGAASRSFRQSDVHQTVVGEDELVQLLQAALTKAVPVMNEKLQARLAQQNNRPKIKLSVKAGAADPALVEIDGMLIGTTPLANFQVYAGDHVITIGKAGYQDVSKQILLKTDTAIEVPLFRTKLSAEEMKDVLDKARVNVIAGTGGVEPAWIINTIDSGK